MSSKAHNKLLSETQVTSLLRLFRQKKDLQILRKGYSQILGTNINLKGCVLS